jgi:hypothetical protein
VKRSLLLIAGGVVLVLLLVGAAFVGGRLISGQGLPLPLQPSGAQMITLGQGGKNTTVSLDVDPAPELPASPPDVKGIFQRRADNSLFIGTGQVSVMAQKSQSGVISMTSHYDGPLVEVVITHDTTIYRDVTMKQFDNPPPAGKKLQQVLEPGSADEIGANSMVTVWGDRRGDRITARVLTYSLPAFFRKGP